jgi:hypothetical protein
MNRDSTRAADKVLGIFLPETRHLLFRGRLVGEGLVLT